VGHEAVQDFIGVDGVGFCMKIQQDTMTQDGNDPLTAYSSEFKVG